MNSYTTLANIYEKLMKDCDYEKWSQYLLTKLKKYSLGINGLDIACGSGKMTRLLAKNGYKMTGVDISEEMLLNAKHIALKERLNINFFKGDLNNLPRYGNFDFVTIINDGLNYIKQENLQKAFKGIYKQLNKNGVLIFDISSKYKLENIIGNNMFGEDWPEFSYLWFNTLKDNYVKMDLSFFIKQGDLYSKSEETHIQYIHTVNNIISIAKDNGFEVLENDEDGTIERLNFIFRRV